MAGLDKTVNNLYERDIKGTAKKPWKSIDPVGHFKNSVKDISGVFTPEVPMPEKETIIPIPSSSLAENEARKRRARASRSGSGRSSTILTEGLGG